MRSMGFGQFTQISPCRECGGSGRIIKDPCTKCRGQGRVKKQRSITVKIPRGVATGTKLRLAGEGEAGMNGGPSGDLYVFLHVKPHPRFERHGDDLYYELPLSFPQAALGAEVEVTTMEGTTRLQIPGGSQNGSTFKIRGKGMPHINGGGHGNMMVITQVMVPKKLSPKEKELIQQLADETGANVKKRFGIRK